jgi:hypothetical protein
MRVVIQLKQGPIPTHRPGVARRVALAAGVILQPIALMAATLACWRLADIADLAVDFAVLEGPFSNWETWGGLAGLFLLTSMLRNQYGKRGRAAH